MTNKMQIFGLFTCTQSALHVHISGEVFAHHQEHLTVYTAFDMVHLEVDYISSCKYSQVLLIMGENVVRNI